MLSNTQQVEICTQTEQSRAKQQAVGSDKNCNRSGDAQVEEFAIGDPDARISLSRGI